MKALNLIGINGAVQGGQFEFDFAFAPKALKPSVSVPTIAENFASALRQLAALSQDSSNALSGCATPSDFPLVLQRASISTFTQDIVDRLVGNGRNIEDIYPLTPLQEGMLFHTLLDRHSEEYVTQMSWSLSKGFDATCFKQAWEAVIKRHAVFRTSFAWEGLSVPVQIVARSIAIDWQEFDWRDSLSSIPPEQISHGIQEMIETVTNEERRLGFNLNERPGFRFKLARSGEARYEFIFTHHHIYLDGWSLALVLGDLFAEYEALIKQQSPPTLPALGAFKDYVNWSQNQDKAKAEKFWRSRLANFSNPTPLPLALPAKEEDTNAPLGDFREALNQTQTKRILDFAKLHKLTINTLVQAAWAILLSAHRYATLLSSAPLLLPL